MSTPKGYLTNLIQFKDHIQSSMEELVDILDTTGTYEDRFNINITMNGKSTSIEFHADAFERLTSMVETEIKEFKEMNSLGYFVDSLSDDDKLALAVLIDKTEAPTQKKYTIVDGQDGHASVITEDGLRVLAIYYYDNSDVLEDIDFNNIQNCIDFVRRVDKVEEVTE